MDAILCLEPLMRPFRRFRAQAWVRLCRVVDLEVIARSVVDGVKHGLEIEPDIVVLRAERDRNRPATAAKAGSARPPHPVADPRVRHERSSRGAEFACAVPVRRPCRSKSISTQWLFDFMTARRFFRKLLSPCDRETLLSGLSTSMTVTTRRFSESMISRKCSLIVSSMNVSMINGSATLVPTPSTFGEADRFRPVRGEIWTSGTNTVRPGSSPVER